MTTDELPAYDSRTATLQHSLRVGELMVMTITELAQRSVAHDLSKTMPPEVETFDEFTPKLKGTAYPSPEYSGFLAAMKPALDHHYANNRHHPEHFPDGVNGMTLVDLIEMLADWKASGERMADGGDLRRSIKVNTDRFGLSPQLVQILLNTGEHFGWIPVERLLPEATTEPTAATWPTGGDA